MTGQNGRQRTLFVTYLEPLDFAVDAARRSGYQMGGAVDELHRPAS